MNAFTLFTITQKARYLIDRYDLEEISILVIIFAETWRNDRITPNFKTSRNILKLFRMFPRGEDEREFFVTL